MTLPQGAGVWDPGDTAGRMCNDTSATPRNCQRALADKPVIAQVAIAISLAWQPTATRRRAAAQVMTSTRATQASACRRPSTVMSAATSCRPIGADLPMWTVNLKRRDDLAGTRARRPAGEALIYDADTGLTSS